MGAPLALLICGLGVVGLFYLNWDKSVRTSKALWLPVIWLLIVGSRPVSAWFGLGGPSGGALASTLDGSPWDAAVFGALMVFGIAVLFGRKARTRALLAVSGPIVVYFLYCLLSVAWSPIHGPAFKRWTKAIGDLVMVLLILTDAQPRAALQRLYSRVGFDFIALFHCFDPVHRSGPRIRSRRKPHEHGGDNKQEQSRPHRILDFSGCPMDAARASQQ